jgi:uncharacterized protein (TIGR02679 family)
VEAAGAGARSVTVRGLGEDERTALADLLGWRSVPAGDVRVDLAVLDAALRASRAGMSLAEVLDGIGGALRDRRAERASARAARETAWNDARARLADRDDLAAWLDALRKLGAIARAARAAGRSESAVLEDAVRVARALPAGGRLLPVLAAELLGDPHALDVGAPLAGIALRAAAAVAGWPAVPATAWARRRLWSEVGVDCDALSAQVLVLGLRPLGEGFLARQLRECAAAGEPRRITLREVRRSPLTVSSGTPVRVCENPAIVAAAADAHGARCAPLVCVEGVPSTAAMELLRGLAACGAAVRARADFDWAGLRIAAQVLAATGGAPWRFGAEHYQSVVARGTGAPLDGRPAPSPWDPLLSEAMAAQRRAVPEESLLAELLADLEANPPVGAHSCRCGRGGLPA